MASRILLFRQYMNHKMKEDTSIKHHILDMNGMVKGLERQGVKLPENVQAMVLMESLPESWEYVVTSISLNLGIDDDALGIDNICKKLLREESSITDPPLLDGSNYTYWKPRMRDFIEAMDEEAWNIVLTGWTRPVTRNDDGTTIEKPSRTWTTEEVRLVKLNQSVLGTIFDGVNCDQFNFIARCESARDAWDTLQTIHEGTPAVRSLKCQMLKTRFESLGMSDNETIPEFKAKLREIADEAFALGEEFPEVELVRKTLRSLPKRFAKKVTTIEEARDLHSMKLDELMESLNIYELKLEEKRRVRTLTGDCSN